MFGVGAQHTVYREKSLMKLLQGNTWYIAYRRPVRKRRHAVRRGQDSVYDYVWDITIGVDATFIFARLIMGSRPFSSVPRLLGLGPGPVCMAEGAARVPVIGLFPYVLQ